jgi:mRNA-degrading endonuclease RelE of RelBE toxin-antitoxin system
MAWTVKIKRKLRKQLGRLPKSAQNSLKLLIKEIEIDGPVKGSWPNYSRLSNNRHHCHLKKGRPTYVAIWEVINKDAKLVEVTYAGTHEKAPY